MRGDLNEKRTTPVPFVAFQPIQSSCIPLEIFLHGGGVVKRMRDADCEAPGVLVTGRRPCIDDCGLGRSFQLMIADFDSDLMLVDICLQERGRPNCVPLVTHAKADFSGLAAQMGAFSVAYQQGQVATAPDDLYATFDRMVKRQPAQNKLVRQTGKPSVAWSLLMWLPIR